MKNLLITGAGGFVGQSLAEYLSAFNSYKVFALRHKELDLLNEGEVENFIYTNKIDIILHCANVGGSRKANYNLNCVDIVEKNLRMFTNLERNLRGGIKMIYFGSGAEYDRFRENVKTREEQFDEVVPNDSYGYGKYVMSKISSHHDNIICLRIFGLYGKFEDYQFRFISNAIIKNLLKLPIVINRNVFFDYLYIDDFCKIVKYFIDNKTKYNQYNLTPTNTVDLLTLAKLINSVSDYQSPIYITNEGMNNEYSGFNGRLLEELGSFAFTTHQVAIKELFQYYKENLKNLDVKSVQDDVYLSLCK